VVSVAWVRASAETLTAFRVHCICRDGSEMEPAVVNITYRVFMCSHFVPSPALKDWVWVRYRRLQRIKHRLMMLTTTRDISSTLHATYASLGAARNIEQKNGANSIRGVVL
jgi:hypothetical protein